MFLHRTAMHDRVLPLGANRFPGLRRASVARGTYSLPAEEPDPLLSADAKRAPGRDQTRVTPLPLR
jgi:hypothetical protein